MAFNKFRQKTSLLLRGFSFILGFFLFAATAFLPSPAMAASPRIYLYPQTGYALLGENFTADIMLDTRGSDTTKVKAVIEFDPELVEVTEAKHGDIFCQYPEDEYTVDNQEGWIVLTGFCLDPIYRTSSEAELFGRFTFRPRKEGTVDMDFITENGTDDNYTLAMDTSSPPQVIDVTAEGAQYTIASDVSPGDPGKDPGDGDGDDDLPDVGSFDTNIFWIGGGLIGLGAGIFISSGLISKIKNASQKRNKRTIIA
jgi:hypothetical protein